MAKEASIVRKREKFEARIAEVKSLPNAALAEMTAHGDRLMEEFN